MIDEFTLNAQVREGCGRSAIRRLRRTGMVPGIVYGADKEPMPIAIEDRIIKQNLSHEAFFSHILTLTVNGGAERVILRDLQRHPANSLVMHIDLQRVSEDEEIRVRVPLHFVGEEQAPGVKLERGVVSHMMTEVEVSCLPRDLPEYIEVDVSNLHLNDAVHLSDLKIPQDVELVELSYGEEHDTAVVSINPPRVEEEEQPEALEAFEASVEREQTEGETGNEDER
ncbi:MAG TPA: 50S ribosomal protein L25/general stress protein Ctc [Gammaproteobacteria bacterium]|nr:50S ribosomal protein L25/general stress protein Ctc [Gammaproteobacteria bacterium]HKH21287.1 50S ribosomal protein L25/general stress protein Ctc [Gammaproteobacteria bacterium]